MSAENLGGGLFFYFGAKISTKDSNALSGPIPDGAASWQELRGLYLGSNRLLGAIPDAVASWRSVRVLVAQIARCNRDVRCDSNRTRPNR